eukprot:1841116-Amphidinium_carterae.1
MFYYGRWEALLDIHTEEDAHRALKDRVDPPPGYEDVFEGYETYKFDEQVAHSRTAMEILAATQKDKRIWQYAIIPPVPHRSTAGRADASESNELPANTAVIPELGAAMAGEAEEVTYVDLFMDDTARENQEAEYENYDDDDDDDDDNGSQATDMSFDQWEQRNAEALNSDECGFGLEDDRDIDQRFEESGLQPDQDGVIPWDAVIQSEKSADYDEDLAKELEGHYAAGHIPKDPRRPVCQRADGPVRRHKGSPTELKQTHILTVDLMGPFPPNYPKKFKYALVGAYRGKLAETGLPSPLLPLAIPIKSKEGKEVAEAVRKAILMIESLHTGLYEEGKISFVVFSDRGSEFMNRHMTDNLNNLAIHQDFTSGYSPQSSGAAK